MEQKGRTAAQRLDALVEKGRQAGAAADMTDPGCLLRVLSMYESPEVNRVIRVYRQFRHALGRDPSAEEIAAELHMPVGRVRGLIARAQAPVDWETGASEPEHPL